MGVYLGASTKIVDRATGEVFMGEVPAYSVVVPGSLPGKPLPDASPGPSLYCAVIVTRVDAKTRAKTGINELLRDRFPATRCVSPPSPATGRQRFRRPSRYHRSPGMAARA